MTSPKAEKFSIGYDSRFQIYPPRGGEVEAAMIETERTLERHDKLRKAQKENFLNVIEAQRARAQELEQAFGKEKLEAMSSFIRERRRQRYALLRTNKDRPAALTRSSADRIREGREFLSKLSVDSNKVHEIRKRFLSPSMYTYSGASAQETNIVLTSVERLPSAVQQIIAGAAPIPRMQTLDLKFNVRSPPYDGWDWSFGWQRRGGADPDLINFLDPVNGAVGASVHFWDFDPGEDDFFAYEFNTAHGIWIEVPAGASHLQVMFALKCDTAYSSIYQNDDSGWFDPSDSDIRAFTNAIAPETQAGVWSTFASGAPDGSTETKTWYSPGDISWFHGAQFLGNLGKAFPFYVRVGLRNVVHASTEEVELSVIQRDRWYVDAIIAWVNP